MNLIRRYGLSMLLLAPALFAEAQERPSMEAQLSVGNLAAITEATCSNGGGQLMAGGSFRYYVTGKTSLGPELVYFRPCDRQAFTFHHPQMTGLLQIARDLTQGNVRPYLIAGAGFIRHRSLYPQPAKAELTAGAGIKISVTNRTFIAPELQFGLGTVSTRLSVSVGVILR
jgi:hypothetical protein